MPRHGTTTIRWCSAIPDAKSREQSGTMSASWPSMKLHGVMVSHRGAADFRVRLRRRQTRSANGVVLLQPQTYMNDLGRAVQEAMSFYKLALSNLTVFHDELELAACQAASKSRRRACRPQRPAFDLFAYWQRLSPCPTRSRSSPRLVRCSPSGLKERRAQATCCPILPRSDRAWVEALLRSHRR